MQPGEFQRISQMQPVSYGEKALRSNALEIDTAQFGKIQVEEDKIITMRTDIIGFAGKKHFIIFEKESTRPFYWFQCIDNPNIALTIINPYLFKPDYSVDVEYALKEMSWDNDGK